MTKTPKCQICKYNQATWAMQYIAEATPTFYALGWHIRGFAVTKICSDCKNKIQKEQNMNEQNTTQEPTQETQEPTQETQQEHPDWITKQAGAYDVRCYRCNKAYHFGETIHQYSPPAPFTETWQDASWCEDCAKDIRAEFDEFDAQPW